MYLLCKLLLWCHLLFYIWILIFMMTSYYSKLVSTQILTTLFINEGCKECHAHQWSFYLSLVRKICNVPHSSWSFFTLKNLTYSFSYIKVCPFTVMINILNKYRNINQQQSRWLWWLNCQYLMIIYQGRKKIWGGTQYYKVIWWNKFHS